MERKLLSHHRETREMCADACQRVHPISVHPNFQRDPVATGEGDPGHSGRSSGLVVKETKGSQTHVYPTRHA